MEKEGTFRERDLICPYCGYEDEEGGLLVDTNGIEGVTTCQSCDKNFHYEAELLFSTSRSCTLNKEQHTWPEFGEPIESRHGDGWFQCRHCEECDAFEAREHYTISVRS